MEPWREWTFSKGSTLLYGTNLESRMIKDYKIPVTMKETHRPMEQNLELRTKVLPIQSTNISQGSHGYSVEKDNPTPLTKKKKDAHNKYLNVRL